MHKDCAYATAAIVCILALTPCILVSSRREHRVAQQGDDAHQNPGADTLGSEDDPELQEGGCRQGSSLCGQHNIALGAKFTEGQFAVDADSPNSTVSTWSTAEGSSLDSNLNESIARFEEAASLVNSSQVEKNESSTFEGNPATKSLVVEGSTPNPKFKFDEDEDMADDHVTIRLEEDDFQIEGTSWEDGKSSVKSIVDEQGTSWEDTKSSVKSSQNNETVFSIMPNPNVKVDEDMADDQITITVKLDESSFKMSTPTEILVVDGKTPNPNFKLDEDVADAGVEDSTPNPNLKLDEDIPLADDKTTITIDEDEFEVTWG